MSVRGMAGRFQCKSSIDGVDRNTYYHTFSSRRTTPAPTTCTYTRQFNYKICRHFSARQKSSQFNHKAWPGASSLSPQDGRVVAKHAQTKCTRSFARLPDVSRQGKARYCTARNSFVAFYLLCQTVLELSIIDPLLLTCQKGSCGAFHTAIVVPEL